MQNTISKRPTWDELNIELKPVLRSTAATSPSRVALAVTTRGLSVGFTSDSIRRWLNAHDPERFAAITATPRSFRRTVSLAKRHIKSSSDPSGWGAEAALIASRLVGLLLAPVDESRGLTPHQITQARRALAVIGVAAVESMRTKGWDTVLVHSTRLAVDLGVTPKTAAKIQRWCEQAGWLIVRTDRRDKRGGVRYYVRKKLPSVARDAAWSLYDSHDPIGTGEQGVDDIADLVLLANHPAWGFAKGEDDEGSTERGTKVWLTALADAAEVDPVTLGVGARAVTKHRRAWIEMLHEYPVDTPLKALLDADARKTGADVRWVEAETARRTKAEADVVERTVHGGAKDWAHQACAQLVTKGRPIPLPGASTEVQHAWLTAMHAAVSGIGDLDERHRKLLAKRIAELMAHDDVGYDEATAVLVGKRIVGLE